MAGSGASLKKNSVEIMKDAKVIARADSDCEGGEVVELNQTFNTLSTFSLAVSLMALWEALCSTMGIGLRSGGCVSLIYGFIVSFIGSMCTAMSLSEPASMFPNAGGQYYMISRLSSQKTKAILSWYTGWASLLGWVALTASAPFGAANITQGLITLNNTDYVAERWHWYLIYLGITLLAFFLNVWGGKVLPTLENMIMVFHVLFFFAILIAGAALPRERQTAEFVFTNFQNSTGWESDGIAWGIGMLTSAYIMVGYDSATHISEEMKNPRVGVPWAMVGAIFTNGLMGFAILLVVLFGMNDMQAALDSKTGFPIIEIFYGMTRGNKAAASAMACTIVISASLATVGLITSTSRILWSFARDGAPIFSVPLTRISESSHIPFNAVAAISSVVIILGLLNIASTTAFNAVLSLTVIALSLSYFIPVVAMLYRRIMTPETLKWGPWRLPSAVGITANIISVCYIIFLCFFLVLPSTMPVNAENMNYACVLLGGVFIITTVDWVFRGRKVFRGPIADL